MSFAFPSFVLWLTAIISFVYFLFVITKIYERGALARI